MQSGNGFHRAALASCRTLEQKNDTLRAKEAMQLDMLRGYEGATDKMSRLLCSLAGREGSDADASRTALSAAMDVLHSGAQQLLQQVSSPAHTSGFWGHRSSPQHNSDSSDFTNVVAPVPACCGRHTQLIWSRITPEAVLAMKDITTKQLAGALSVLC